MRYNIKKKDLDMISTLIYLPRDLNLTILYLARKSGTTKDVVIEYLIRLGLEYLEKGEVESEKV